MELVILGIVIGVFILVRIFRKPTREPCEHDWKYEGYNMSADRTWKIKHYQCTKCMKTKTDEIGGG